MKRYLAGLGQNERLLLALGGAILVLAVLSFGVWLPLDTRVDRMRTTIGDQRALLQWMQTSAQEVRRLRQTQPRQPAEHQSLLALSDRAAREAGLGPAIRRVEPEGNDRVRIVLEQAGFDDMTNWLEQLVNRSQIRIDNVTVDNRPEPGLVNARLLLQAPAP
ncbi:MAG: type II secretion system protein M [Chromatiales bacterium]|jgi:general secretion pathway protein M|nr:type II secretion system protein M [Chromatiales bacterium]